MMIGRRSGKVFLTAGLILFCPQAAWAASNNDGHALLAGIGISIIAATVFGYLGNLLRQPLLLAYIAAGAAIGPNFGLALVHSKEDIRIITEIGLILLLFMIGLELDLKKLKESGKSFLVTGIFQFILCVALGLGFFLLLGFTIGPPYKYRIFGVTVLGGEYDLLYLAVCIALSSTAIVVKLLYEKFEMDTLAGRITLGVLVFQDIWAIMMLSVQPTLNDPRLWNILEQFAEGILLVVISLLLSKYLLGFLFRKIAKLPELVLVTSLAWCFLIGGLASYLDLSLEMGALIAGAAISTFPYHTDIIAKIVNIRDFFIVLFFVALGMEIPNPLNNLGMLLVAGVTAVFVIATRFMSVFPLLYLLNNGHRVSLLTSINLSQISEFALVIGAIGLKSGHIVPDIMTLIIYVFAFTAIASSYMIKSSHRLQTWCSKILNNIGIRDIQNQPREEGGPPAKEIALLGFYRVASSFLEELQELAPNLQNQLVVIDFNPGVFYKLKERGVQVIYGDISHLGTLQEAGLEKTKLVISTISDDVLVGTSNFKIIQVMKQLAPEARLIVTATSPSQALQLYQAGANYVLLPNTLAAAHLITMVNCLLREECPGLREKEMERLREGQEVLA